MQVQPYIEQLDSIVSDTFSLLEKNISFFKFIGHADLQNYAQGLAEKYLGLNFKRFKNQDKYFLSFNLCHHPLFSHLTLVYPIPKSKNNQHTFFLSEISIQASGSAPVTEMIVQQLADNDDKSVFLYRGNDTQDFFNLNHSISDDLTSIQFFQLFFKQIILVINQIFPVIQSIESIRSILFNPAIAQGILRKEMTWDVWAHKFSHHITQAQIDTHRVDMLWKACIFVSPDPLMLLKIAIGEGLWNPVIDDAKEFYRPVAGTFFHNVATPESIVEPRMYDPWQEQEQAIITFLEKVCLYRKLNGDIDYIENIAKAENTEMTLKI